MRELANAMVLERLKVGVPPDQAVGEGRAVARTARDTVGVQTAGEMLESGMVGRAHWITDNAVLPKLRRSEATPSER